jgi:hypothetical protein
MSNPLRILKALDQHLTLPAEITLFGRAALALGYRKVIHRKVPAAATVSQESTCRRPWQPRGH